MAEEYTGDLSSASGQIGALQQMTAAKALANPNAGLAALSNPLRPNRQVEYDTAKANLDSSYAAKSIEGDDAAMWGALAKGFAAPAENFWQSLANAGGNKAAVVAGIEERNLKNDRDVKKTEYDHASKLLVSSDAIDRTLVGANAKNYYDTKSLGKFVPVTGVPGLMVNNVTKEKLLLQDSDRVLFDKLLLKNKEIYATSEDALHATYLEIAKIKENPAFATPTEKVGPGTPAVTIPPAAAPVPAQNGQNPAPTGPVSAPTAAPSIGGQGASTPQNTQVLKPAPTADMNRSISTKADVNVKDLPVEGLEAIEQSLLKDKDITGAIQIRKVIQSLEAQKKAAENTGNVKLAGAIQNNIDRVKTDFPLTKVQQLEQNSKDASNTKVDLYEEGLPAYKGQLQKYTDPKERQDYLKTIPKRFQDWFEKDVTPIQTDLKDATLATQRLLELQNVPDPNRPGAKLGTGHTSLDNLPIVGGLWQDYRAGKDPRLQEMQSITIDSAMAKRIKGTGVMTDADMRQYMQAAVGINKDPLANENIAAATKALADRWSEFMRYGAKFYNVHGDFDPATVKSTFQQYSDANPLFGGYDKSGRLIINNPPPFEEYFRKGKAKK
jgi:hypothetical protein